MDEETPARILVSDELDNVIIGITVLEATRLGGGSSNRKAKENQVIATLTQ
jgi:hypothetical protein